MLVILACSFPTAVAPSATPVSLAITNTPFSISPAPQTDMSTATANPLPTVELPTPTRETMHALVPSTNVSMGKLVVNDAVSMDTAAEKRAPYGDSYNLNLFERPFMQDMSYVADMDIVSYNLSYDDKFFYVSIELVGSNPNNKIGINYAVELDTNADGFGDYIIVARPPYDANWSTNNVQVAEDTNHDTGGLSAEKSDAPLPGNGYEHIIFDGGRGAEDDPDLAFARVNAGKKATVQFAFKRSLAGGRFIYGVFSDAGIKNIGELDYADRFTEAEAGSPERNEKDYPLKAVYGVDTVCRELFGFKGTGQEPRICRRKR